ncbi:MULTISPECIES: 5-dehydro-4-deoxy-D-glucuronate isomerase [Algibacter]|uniref:4-deoxy-L-threo-5-hexosulose-uronate ketol-isomerase n=1 Tax=Algibacter lectus TaxID=221126 RepID=A0A090VKS6_9FLAO|nr:5-dehydro-4-deoxy-D-glucuronate isomerase [Algibacter lectus]MWW25961.1 5-dehydro-4-deoxy-D-glucuronate isomerase [Algibacter lectus]TDY60689.1 4-deoxy-L-threo-5-hexosulose-uronate ketol-isomerase [Algibacter lectus]GAL64638.1 4-deoxy-L-threo-5-hexosulose-uronate ketol-isomerase [Algibacter lectus]SFD31076.1 4-deoxy-L-threo-5-hexosulose-uronate ketol-isomerase [Algibacter lectus]
MKTNYEVRYAASPQDVKSYDTTRLRDEFLIDNLMSPDEVNLVYSHYDRFISGSAVPVKEALTLEAIDPLKADYFLERRELGIINIGGSGTVTVDGTVYELDNREALYVGKGNKEVVFASKSANEPALFYLNSTPAHKAYPNKKIGINDVEVVQLGAPETANARTLRKYIVNSVVDVCQLQMGMTELKPGSVWNTMPAHVHDRRMEVYFYFDVPAEQSVCHFMGQPQETRHIWMQNNQAVISPAWSVHSGSGTSNYTFIWGMAGENLDYGDMDHCKITELK